MPDQNRKTSDLARGWSAMLLWGLPVIALVVGLYYPRARLVLWIPALVVTGVACLGNAARCGRVHCYVTGPLSLLAATYVALSDFHFVPMQPRMFLDMHRCRCCSGLSGRNPSWQIQKESLRRIDP